MVSIRRQLVPSSQIRDLLVLLLFLAMVALALLYLIPTVWAPVWQEGGLGYSLIEVVITGVPVLTHNSVYLFALGVFCGSSAVWLIDTYRRFAGIVLWMGILFGGALFIRAGYVLTRADFSVGAVVFVVGVFIALQTGGLPLIKRFFGDGTRLLGEPPHRMQRGVQITTAIIIILAVAGIANHHFHGGTALSDLQNTSDVVVHLITLCFIFIPLGLFTRYREPERVIQIGPARSGKTTTQGGLMLGLEDREQDRSPLLEEIVSGYMIEGKFPDRTKVYDTGTISAGELDLSGIGSESVDTHEVSDTEKVSVIEFSYYTKDYLFPKEKIITTVDYPGELLSGTEGGEINPLSEYLSSNGDEKDWDTAISYLKENNEALEPRKLMRHVGYLVQDAEHIVFTLPMDDYIGPIVSNRPSKVPAYHRDVVWKIRDSGNREISDVDRDENDHTYEIRSLVDNEWIPLEKDGNKFYPTTGSVLGFTPDRDQWLGKSGEYYVRNSQRRGREHPDLYLSEYRNIVGELDMTEHRFMWLATMADLVYEDFKSALERAREYDLTYTNSENIEVDTENEEVRVGRSEIGQKGVDMLRTGLLSRTDPVNPAAKRAEYILFSRWIQEEYLTWYEPRFTDWFEQTFESHVFPVWFDIQQESRESQFLNQNPPMNGTNYVVDRFRGKYLRETYPGGNVQVVRTWLGRDLAGTLPESRMAYQILTEVRRECKG